MLLLPANLAPLARLAAKESTRWATAAVHVVVTDEGYTAEATDSRFAGRVTGQHVDAADCFPRIPALMAAPNGATEALIPSDDWTRAFRALPKGRTVAAKPILGNLAMVASKESATLASTDLAQATVQEVQTVQGRFPPLHQLLNDLGKPQLSIDVDARQLAELLTVAAGFAGDESLSRVTLEFRWKGTSKRPDFAPVVVRTQREGQRFEGLAMPLSDQPHAQAPAPYEPTAEEWSEALRADEPAAPPAPVDALGGLAEWEAKPTPGATPASLSASAVAEYFAAKAQGPTAVAKPAKQEDKGPPPAKRVKGKCAHPMGSRIKVAGTWMCKRCCKHVNPADKPAPLGV